MEWLIAVLGLAVVMLVALYRKSMNECRDLTNFALFILLDESVCAAQRKALTDLVRTTDADNAGDLSVKVNLAMVQLAARLSDTLLSTVGLLWKLRTEQSS